MSSYRVGIIGCGGISNAHARGYLALGMDIVAAADIKQEQFARFHDLYGIRSLYTDYRKMLTNEELDIVSIYTWL
jgi:predicted dehydrogenase